MDKGCRNKIIKIVSAHKEPDQKTKDKVWSLIESDISKPLCQAYIVTCDAINASIDLIGCDFLMIHRDRLGRDILNEFARGK